LAIPTAVFLVVSIDIINVQDHRYWLEEVAPWYGKGDFPFFCFFFSGLTVTALLKLTL
jgi:hypothetical protein